MISHILTGDPSPWILNLPVGYSYIPSVGDLASTFWLQAVEWAKTYSYAYEDMRG